MSDPFIAEIRVFPYNFAPRGWLACEGQILPINTNTALFSLLGTTYGGNGQSTFALPDLRGHFPMGPGAGPGLTPRELGEKAGSASVALTTAQMPSHSHGLRATSSANTASPAGAALANVATAGPVYRAPGKLAPSAGNLAASGSGQPHENRQPALALTFCIATSGIFPPRP